MNEDLTQLRLLSLFHYLVGAVAALCACLFLSHLILGLTMLVSPESIINDNSPRPSVFAGYLFTVMGGSFFLFGIVFSLCLIHSGNLLKKQQNHLFSFLMACIACLFMPLGTVLGIFTIMVLSRQSVKRLYGLETAGH